MRIGLVLLPCALTLAGLPAGAGERICIENGTGDAWLFTVDADTGDRATADLAPGGRLCLVPGGRGTVAVFASADDLEGCSRRVDAGSITRLTDFPGVDICSWETLPPQ